MNDENTIDKKFQKELNSGITALILLSVLARSDEPMYGYQIAKLIDTGQEDAPRFKQGVLYPVLRSLEKNTLVESSVEPSVSGPPRRYYRVTETGQAAFERWVILWQQTADFVDDRLEGESNE